MNKNILISAAITAGAVACYYLVRKKLKNAAGQVPQIAAPRSRHLTNLFAKAKHG